MGSPWSLETFNPSYWSEDPVQIATEGRKVVGELVDPVVVDDVPERSRA